MTSPTRSAKGITGSGMMAMVNQKVAFGNYTGAPVRQPGRGLGLAIGLRAARDGANIVIAAKTAEPHKKLPGTIYSAAEEVEKAGGQALPIVVDVREHDSVTAAVEAAVERFGGIDICVNNASAIQLTGTLQTDIRRYDLMNQVNARGTFTVSKVFGWKARRSSCGSGRLRNGARTSRYGRRYRRTSAHR